MLALPPLFLVALGGAIGSVLRYLVGRWATAALPGAFPAGTWAVNLLGGLLMGMLAAHVARTGAAGEPLRLLLGVGLLGGFTTFSAFSLEVFTMIGKGDAGLAGAYVAASVAGSVIAVLAGVWLITALGRG